MIFMDVYAKSIKEKQEKPKEKKMKEKDDRIVVRDLETEKVFIPALGVSKNDLVVKVNVEKNVIVMKVNTPKMSKALLERMEVITDVKIDVNTDYNAADATVSVKNGIIMIVSPVKNTIKNVTVG